MEPSPVSQPRRFLRFAGRLWENMEFERETGWETETVHRLPEPDDRYRVVLQDGEGGVLVAATPGFERDLCRAAYGGMEWERLVAYVPLHPDARAVELRRGEQVLHRAEIAGRRPTVRITRLDPPDGESVGLAWAAEHDRPLRYHVAFVDGRGRAFTVARGLDRRDLTVDTSRYPGGAACRLAVLATDGLRSAHALSGPFPIPEKPLRVVLLTPADGATLPPDQPLSLGGQVLDPSSGSASAPRWKSDGGSRPPRWGSCPRRRPRLPRGRASRRAAPQTSRARRRELAKSTAITMTMVTSSTVDAAG
jgi:hypothetical protein